MYLLPLILSLVSRTSGSHCYYPNGTRSDPATTFACNSSSTTGSACCGIESGQPDACTTSGLCVGGHAGFYYRGWCTDESFDSDACASVCVDGMSLQDGLSMRLC